MQKIFVYAFLYNAAVIASFIWGFSVGKNLQLLIVGSIALIGLNYMTTFKAYKIIRAKKYAVNS